MGQKVQAVYNAHIVGAQQVTNSIKVSANKKRKKILPPMISVITPVYNAENYIARAIESVQAQGFNDYEHIIINDGSSDNTSKVVERYAKKDQRIKLISQKNAGAAAARNKGLECAKGEYVTFVDGDDFIETNTFDVLISAALKNGNDLICFRKDLYYNNNGEKRNESFFYNNKQLPEVFCPTVDIGYEVFFFTSAPLDVVGFYSREFLVQNNLSFSTKFQRNEDFLFKAKALLCAQKVSFIDEALYHYRVGMDNNASSTLDSHKDVGWKILLELQDLIKQGRYSKDVIKSLQIISCEFLWHYIFNMKSYEGQKHAFEKTKDVALQLKLNTMTDPGDIYTHINFYQHIQKILKEEYSHYLWISISQAGKHIDSLTATLHKESTAVQQLSAELDSIYNSKFWLVSERLRRIISILRFKPKS